MTAAAAVTFVLGVTLGLSQSFWAVIAAVVATQSSLGGTLKASFEQFIGSVFGAVWGGAITIVIPHQAPWMLGLALVIAVAPLAWLTTFSPGFRIAPITAILVLLSSMGITMGPVDFAVERLLEIGLGCAVGLGVSVLLVPAHAYDAVLRVAGQVAGLLADQLEVLATIWEHPEINVSALPTEIRLSLGKLEGARRRSGSGAAHVPGQGARSGAAVAHPGTASYGHQHARAHLDQAPPRSRAPASGRTLVEGSESGSSRSAADKPSASSPPIASELGSGDRGHCGL